MLRILTYMASRTRIDMSAEGSGPAALGGAAAFGSAEGTTSLGCRR
jgi:hypothetical protein